MDKLRKAGDIEGLVAALEFRDVVVDPDGRREDRGAPVRLDAITALSAFPGPAVAEAFTAAVSDTHPAVRAAAVGALSEVGTTTIEPLIDGLATWQAPPYGKAVQAALEALAGASEDRVPEALVSRLIGDDAVPLQEWHPEVLAILVSADPRGEQTWDALAEQVIFDIQNASEVSHRERAEEILSWLAPASADAVVRALANGRSEPALLRAAGGLGDVRAVEPLLRTLHRPEPQIRSAAAAALGRVRDTRAVPSLLSATQDPDLNVRGAASEALDRMGIAAVVFGLASVRGADVGDQVVRTASPAQHLESSSWMERAVARVARRAS